MKLAEMLGCADIGQLNRIAQAYAVSCNTHSKNELIQTILRVISSREALKQQLAAMSLDELRFLNTLLFDQQPAYSLEELAARVQLSRFDLKDDRDKKGAPRDTIVKFKHAGWLFNGVAGPSRYLFHVPADLKERVVEVLTEHYRALLVYTEEPEAFRDEQQLFAEDLLRLLDYIHHYEPPLTNEGVMYRRSIQQLAEALHVQEELPAKGAWRFGYGRRVRDYPNRMALLYDYAFYNGLVREHGNALLLTEVGRTYREERKLEEPTRLYRFWLRLYKNAIPNLHALTNWIDRLAGSWVTTESLTRCLLPFIRPYYYDEPATIMEQRMLCMLMHLGIMRIGEKAGGGQVVRMTAVGHAVLAGVHVATHDKITLD